MLSPSQIGERSEAMVLSMLTKAGRSVLIPFGSHLRYDLVIDDEGSFLRVQCKTGRIRNGVVLFRACSSTNAIAQGYKGQADLFGVYCPDNDAVYIVPVDDATENSISLRLTPSGNNQSKGVRWASDYLLCA